MADGTIVGPVGVGVCVEDGTLDVVVELRLLVEVRLVEVTESVPLVDDTELERELLDPVELAESVLLDDDAVVFKLYSCSRLPAPQ